MIVYRTNWIVDTKADGLCALRMRVRWCRSACIATFALPFRIDGSKWAQMAQRVKPNTTHGPHHTSAADINRMIADYESHIETLFAAYSEPPTPEQLKSDFNALLYGMPNNSPTVCKLIDTFIATQSGVSGWSAAMFTKYRTLGRHFAKFAPKLTIDELTADHLRGFTKMMIESGYKNSYTAKMYDFLKTFLLWAKANGRYDGAALETYKLRLKGSENKQAVVYLTWDELQTLYSFPFENQAYSCARDVFCFCCFSGLRWSDAAKLKQGDVHGDHIEVITLKTTDSLKIELNDYSRAILDKYKRTNPEAKALPVVANAQMNRYLKEIGRLAGLDEQVKKVWFVGSVRHESNQPKWQLLTTHVARRTFVVNALYLGISPSVIMQWTGHSKYETMKPYIAIVDELKQSEMAKFNRH